MLERWLGSLSTVKIGFQTPWSRIAVYGSSKPAESYDVVLLAIEVRVDGKLAVAVTESPLKDALDKLNSVSDIFEADVHLADDDLVVIEQENTFAGALRHCN